MTLTKEEKERYARHLILPDFGEKGQRELKNTKVLVVGAGGLGAPLLQYLTAAGIGTIGVADFDSIDTTNLQRQVLFDEQDVGKKKSTVAIEKLRRQNRMVTFIEHPEKLSSANALDILIGYDIIADGSDNFPTRYLINDACFFLQKPYVYGSIYRFEGQVSVFNFQEGPNYRDLFPTPPPPDMVPSCAEGGVLGVLPGIIGSLQANEVIKLAAGIGTSLSGKLFVIDALDFSTRTINIRQDPANPLSGENPSIRELIDYEAFCGIKRTENIPSMTVQELRQMQQEAEEFTLIDVREKHEYEAANLNGLLLPLGEIEEHLHRIPRDQPVVVHCRSGKRSADAISLLQRKHGYENLYNLEGGILAWKVTYDPEMDVN